MGQDVGVKIIDKRKNWEARVEMAVFRLSKDQLGTYEKLVYAILCGHSNKSGDAMLYAKTIADEASCSDRQVRRALANLEACRLIIRKAQYGQDGGRVFNIYEVYGIENYTPMTDSQGGRTDRQPPHDCEAGLNICAEQHQENSKTSSPTESAELAPGEHRPVEIHEIPSVMRPTVEYFLSKTGRQNITAEELIPLRELERLHYPTRVNSEIGTAVERFRRSGRDPTTLTIDYLYESLRHQPGREKKSRASPSDRKREQEERQKNIEWERQRQEEILRRFGGDDD